MSETAAERALMAERHDDGDGRNATWHMSVNRMGSMLAAIRNEARAEALREAENAIGDMEPKLAHEGVVWVRYQHVLAILASGEGSSPGEKADPSASAPGPLDPATEGYVVVVDRSLPCPLDPKCYRYQGHDGEHMYAEPPAQQLNHAISDSIASTPPKKKRK